MQLHLLFTCFQAVDYESSRFINQILKLEMTSMGKQSFGTIVKISKEMEKLSSLMNREETLHKQLQSMLKHSPSSSSSSRSSRLRQYFQEYNNPTTKSLPFEEPNCNNSQQDQTEIINTIYRNNGQVSEEEDREVLHDDKSTVILNAQLLGRKDSQRPFSSHPHNYSSTNQESRVALKYNHSKKKGQRKNPTSSMPAESFNSPGEHKSCLLQKNSSLNKQLYKAESPHLRPKKDEEAMEPVFIKELKGKLSKVGKIDKEELNRLQQKKAGKRTDMSSHRKKTKRELAGAKSSVNIPSTSHTQKTSHSNLPMSTKNYSNIHQKADSKKKDKKVQQKGLSSHQWQQKQQKQPKKLNRVNITKLQQNMKKNLQKKQILRDPVMKKFDRSTQKKINNKRQNGRKQLKLHFTQSQEPPMKKLIQEKELSRDYAKQTKRYEQALNNISKDYFQILIKECRQTSEEAVFKIKLVTLLLYFFEQFASPPLISQASNDPFNQDFYGFIPQQQIIDVLLHPKRTLDLMISLPRLLMEVNKISSERISIFSTKFQQVNQQLDQELQFFLIKKSPLFMYVHSLSEYLTFLVEKQLVVRTKRTKIALESQKEPKLRGFYSSRSKRGQTKKLLKKTEKNDRLGFRCDSDRKITLQDEQIFLRGLKSGKKHLMKKIAR